MSSLLDRKRAIDAARAQKVVEVERKRKEAEVRRHPLLKNGASRDVRDAYFLGLVFAAVANDEKLDSAEERTVRDFGRALELPSEDVNESIAAVQRCGTDDESVEKKLALIEECVKAMRQVSFVRLFICDFETVWNAGKGKRADLEDFKSMFNEWVRDADLVVDEKSISPRKQKGSAALNRVSKKKSATGRRLSKRSKYEEGFDNFDDLMDSMAREYAGDMSLGARDLIRMNELIRPYAQWPVDWRTAAVSIVIGAKEERINSHDAIIKMYCVAILWALKRGWEPLKTGSSILRPLRNLLKEGLSPMSCGERLSEFVQQELEVDGVSL